MKKATLQPLICLLCFLATHAISGLRRAEVSVLAVTELPADTKVSEPESGTDATTEGGLTGAADNGSTGLPWPKTSARPGTKHRHSRIQQQLLLSPEELRIRQRISDFQMYYSSVLSVSGIVTNFLAASVFVYKLKREGQKTVAMLMICLSITDTLSLFQQVDLAIYRWTSLRLTLTKTTASGCQIMIFVSSWARDCSSYFILAFTVDRFVAVWFPLRRRTIVTNTKMLVAMAIIVMTSAVAESYMLILKLIRYVPLPERCLPTSVENGNLLGLYNAIFRYGLGFIVPCTAVAILNGLIVMRVRQHHSQRASMMPAARSDINAPASETQSRSLTRMLVVVSTFSFACSLPQAMLFVWMTFYGVNTGLMFYSVSIILSCLSQLNYTSNFFLYSLTGVEFRKDLKEMMDKLCFGKGVAFKDKRKASCDKATASTGTQGGSHN